ncbi:unnamed protein product [Bursaphelenchus xylophilus]|uniref:(pine wood nematode) hypothetical protein n=1 Tax=Bursaphelenchus xylophilus TaxID=6326 RepID=A0A1I7S812_BURXY|nr:unnamed protein product [Bursaphelenchus xylophilus]CAG9087330.1 unnamed protein product [Bursaphelenchus xylophilus]
MQKQKQSKRTTRKTVKEDIGAGSCESTQKASSKYNNEPKTSTRRRRKSTRPRHRTSVMTAEEVDAPRASRTRRSRGTRTFETREDDQAETQQDDLSRGNLYRRKKSSRLNDNSPHDRKRKKRPVITLATKVGSDGITENDAVVTAEAEEGENPGVDEKKEEAEADARPKERGIDPAELEKIDFFHYYLSRDDYYTILNEDGDFLIAYNVEKKKQVDLVVRSEQDIKTFPLIYNSDGYSIDGKHPQYTIPAYLKYLTNEKVNLDGETVIVTPQKRKPWIFEEQKACVIHDKKPFKGKDYLIFNGEIKTRGRNQNVYVKKSRNFNAQFLEEISQEHRLFRHMINWSPFAVEVIGYCASHTGVGLILERDDGIRLSDFIEKSSVTKVQKKLFCFDAAIAVCFLHLSNAGIVHGAIQPENFVVDKKFMMAKITNYKHSFALPERRIANFNRIPPVRLKYCSPEIAREGWSKASDVWSLGITMWMLLNGMSKNPLAALSGGFPSQFETDPKLKPVLEGHGDSWKTLFDQMTSIDPNDRPNVQFVAQRLKKIIDKPVGLRFEEDGNLCEHLGAVMFPESHSKIQRKGDKKVGSGATGAGWKAKWGAEV